MGFGGLNGPSYILGGSRSPYNHFVGIIELVQVSAVLTAK